MFYSIWVYTVITDLIWFFCFAKMCRPGISSVQSQNYTVWCNMHQHEKWVESLKSVFTKPHACRCWKPWCWRRRLGLWSTRSDMANAARCNTYDNDMSSTIVLRHLKKDLLAMLRAQKQGLASLRWLQKYWRRPWPSITHMQCQEWNEYERTESRARKTTNVTKPQLEESQNFKPACAALAQRPFTFISFL